MNLYHLRYFVTLAHLEHYTKAAEQLSITQPSLSHAIASLEKELHVRLFEKEGRNVVLTKWGSAFLEEVEEILSLLDRSVENLQMAGSGNGTIDLAFVRTLGTIFVPALMHDYLSANKDKNIHFKLHSAGGLSATIIEGLKSGKYDVAFCSRYKDDSTIDFVPIASQELVLVVPEDHPLSTKDSITLKETLPYPQIMFDHRSGLREIVDNLFTEIGQAPEILMEVEEDQVIAGLVSKGFGIAIVPYLHILESLSVKILKITDPKPKRFFYMATLKGTYKAPLVNSFIEFVEQYDVNPMCIF
ncbi:MAG: LysR family transcriptional regulator [Lachnospiraceae bacterium]